MNKEDVVVTIDKKSWKDKIKEKGAKIGAWCSNHKEALIVFVPLAVTSTVDIVKTVSKNRANKEEKRLKENFIYDRSSGHYYEVSRALKSSEWLTIDRRKQNGEMLGDILQSMRVLK